MELHQDSAPMWVSIPIDNDKNITAIFTTRNGGVSQFPYNTLNFSFQRADRRENVMENFRRLSVAMNIPMEHMVLSRQVHGSNVTIVGKEHRGMGLTRESTYGDTDALVTAEGGVALVTFYADCTPVYLYDPVKGVIGLIHSGWRSTLQNISAKTIRLMKKEFGCHSEDIRAAIGPHIGPCCFEVGDDVYRQFAVLFPNSQDKMKREHNKGKIDLSGIIQETLILEGLAKEHIHDTGRCTVCERKLFFSHRGGEGNSGTGAAVLMMSE